MEQPVIEDKPSEIERLENSLGIQFENLRAARNEARLVRSSLEDKLYKFSSFEASIVTFGSLARDEFTKG